MYKAELTFQFVTNASGKHSFQIVNVTTGKTIMPPMDWYATEKDARNVAEALKKAAFSKWAAGEIFPLSNGNYCVIMNDVPDEASLLPPHVSKPSVLLAALVQHNNTRLYGVAVYTNGGELVMAPGKWFDNGDDAYNYVKDSQEWRAKLCERMAALGMGTLEFVEGMPLLYDKEKQEPEKMGMSEIVNKLLKNNNSPKPSHDVFNKFGKAELN